MKRKFSPSPLPGVHPELQSASVVLQQRTAEFGEIVELLLRKHGKKIVDEQLQLERIADTAIRLFAMTSTISRASKSLSENTTSAAHEVKLTKLYCEIASDQIQQLLSDVQDNKQRDQMSMEIAEEILQHEKYIPSHPVGVNV